MDNEPFIGRGSNGCGNDLPVDRHARAPSTAGDTRRRRAAHERTRTAQDVVWRRRTKHGLRLSPDGIQAIDDASARVRQTMPTAP